MARAVLILPIARYLCDLERGHIEIVFETDDGAFQIVTPHDRRLGEDRIGEMGWITDPCPVLFGLNLILKCSYHRIQVRDQGLDLRDVSAHHIKLQFLQSNERLTRISFPDMALGSAGE